MRVPCAVLAWTMALAAPVAAQDSTAAVVAPALTQRRLCASPGTLARCRDYWDIEFQGGTRWGVGATAMRNTGEWSALGFAVHHTIRERAPGGLTVAEARYRKWYDRDGAVDLALGPAWGRPAAGNRFPLKPNGVTAGLTVVERRHVAVFARLDHVRWHEREPTTNLGVGLQTDSKVALPAIGIAAVVLFGLFYLVSAGSVT